MHKLRLKMWSSFSFLFQSNRGTWIALYCVTSSLPHARV